jgi:hypothetical protein
MRRARRRSGASRSTACGSGLTQRVYIIDTPENVANVAMDYVKY